MDGKELPRLCCEDKAILRPFGNRISSGENNLQYLISDWEKVEIKGSPEGEKDEWKKNRKRIGNQFSCQSGLIVY